MTCKFMRQKTPKVSIRAPRSWKITTWPDYYSFPWTKIICHRTKSLPESLWFCNLKPGIAGEFLSGLCSKNATFVREVQSERPDCGGHVTHIGSQRHLLTSSSFLKIFYLGKFIFNFSGHISGPKYVNMSSRAECRPPATAEMFVNKFAARNQMIGVPAWVSHLLGTM